MECRTRQVRYAAADGFHELSWTHWGAEELPRRVICVHGLTRRGRDFDALARRLVLHGWQVACPDLPGRGLSDRLCDPALYVPPTYLVALSHMLARLDWREVAWVGTSLGGILGMMAASLPGNPVRRLVLNDVGSHIPAAAVARIGAYMRAAPHGFADLAALEAHLRLVHAPFGALSDAEWRHLAGISAVPRDGGGVSLHYDPAIAAAFAGAEPRALDLSAVWARVSCPTLVLRGENSDLLTAEDAAAMATRPGVELATIAGCGHAPALMAHEQLARVAAFLDS